MLASSHGDPPQEVDFLLQNLYIFAPNPHSRYKLRLVVRNHSEEERVSKDQRRCDFRFVLEDALREDESEGEIYLLEREKKEEKSQEYQVVGIGRLDLASCRQREHFSADNRLVNGLIYGVKDVKGQKIIAKFSYRMLKVDKKGETNEFLSPQPLTISRRRQKFPALTFRQSIVDKNAEINSKLNDLTREIDDTFRREKHSSEKLKGLNETIMQTLREFVPQCKEYSYKYSEKMHSLMESSSKRSELYRINIKSIKLCDTNFRKLQRLTSNARLPSQQKEGQSQVKHILVIFYEVFEQFQFRRKLIQLALPIIYNTNNNLKKDTFFYLPKTNNRILLEIRSMQQQLSSVLIGYLKFGDGFNKIIEVFDGQNQEKGFIIALIDEQTILSDQYLKEYQLQLQQHHRLISSYKAKQTGQRRHSVTNQRKQERIAVSRLAKIEGPQQSSEHLLSKKQHKFRKVVNPQFFSIKTQQSDVSVSRSRAVAPQQPSALKQSRVKQYSIPSSPSNQQDISKVRLLNFSNSKRSFKFHQKLHLQSISVNLGSSSHSNVRKVLLRLQLKQQIHMKKVHASNGQDVHWSDIDIHFETTIHMDSRLRIGCYMKEKQGGDSDYREIGRCIISLEEMRNAPDSLYSILLVNANRIAGKVQLKFSLHQSRVLSQIDQYKKQASRLISKQKEEYEMSLNSSVVNPFAKREPRASIHDGTGRPASKKSQINKQPDV